MEPKFQTSFIPKQSLSSIPASPRKSSRSGAFALGTVITTVLFILAVGGSVLLFLYQQYLQASIKSNQESLSKAREAFEPALIKELARLDSRINSSNQILNQHIAPSALFDLLQSITLQNVQFTSFTYDSSPTQGLVHISLTGRARSFKTIALQSDLVGTNQYLKNAVISNLALDSLGGVGFSLDADVDPRTISYMNVKANGTPIPQSGTELPPATTTGANSSAI